MEPRNPEVSASPYRDSGTIYPVPARFIRTPNNTSNGIKKLLLTQMVKAKRAGSWFRLSRRERGLYTLALRLEVKFQSHDLLKALVSVLKSLRDTCDRGYIGLMRAMRVAWAFSEAAVAWGNLGARQWRSDMRYIRFLAIKWGRA
jgi:hypothetical protein